MRNGKFLPIVAAALLCASCIFVDRANGAAVVPEATTTAATTTKAATTTASTTAAAVTTTKAAVTTTAAAATTTKAAVTTTVAATTTKAAATTTKTAATNATTTAAPITTTTEQFVPVPESQCHMPFWHNNGWHHTCVKYNDFGDYWCSLTRNFTRDEVWRRCRSADLKRFQCQIPFEFEGKNHTECLPIEPNSAHGRGAHHSFWCAVVPKIVSWSATGTDWAYCEHGSATGVAYLKEVGIHHDIAEAQKAAGNVTASGAAVLPASDGKSPSKSLSGANAAAGGHGASGAAAGLGAEATVGISVGVVCSVLAVVAVVAGVAVRKRRRSGRDHKALLQTREKGTYGGMEASD